MSTKLTFRMASALPSEPFNFSPTHIINNSIPNTNLLLTQTDLTITEVTRARDEVLPEQMKELKTLIRNARRSIRRSPQSDTDRADLAHMRGFLGMLKEQQTTFGRVLEKEREQKKQLKRLLGLQREYLVKCELPDFEGVERRELKRKIQAASDRAMRVGRASYEMVMKVKEEVERFNGTWVE